MPDEIAVETRAALPFGIVADAALTLVRTAYEAAQSPRGVAGIPTGLPSLDKLLGGLQPGLHILGAEPNAGKTMLALNIARYTVANHGLPVVYASFDEIPELLALKVLAAHANLPASDIIAGRVDPERVAQAIDEHRQALTALTFVNADAKLTPADLIAQLEEKLAFHRAPIGLLVLDYLQPMAAAHAQQAKTGDFRLAIGQLALGIRDLANRARCPVLMISAQNRSGQGTDRMTSLRESSDLEYGADSVMLLTNDNTVATGSSGKAARTLTVAKNRFGRRDVTINLLFDGVTHTVIER